IQLAYADVSTGQFYKTKGSFEDIKIEIEKIEPKEVLILENQKSFFKNLITKYHTTLLDNTYDTNNIENIIKSYCKHTQKDFCTKLDDIIEYNLSNYMAMDETTRKNLELTRTKMYSKRKGSLLWFLNYTKTPMGARLLKQYLNEPLLNIKKIKERQDTLNELISNQNSLEKLEKILECFCDFSRICARISNSTILPKDLLRMATSASFISDLDKLLKNYNSNLLKLDKNKIKYILQLANEIKSAIKEESSDQITLGNIIKEGYSANLDYLNSKLFEIDKQIKNYESKERKKLNIEKLKISSSSILGYYIEIPSAYAQKVSNDYFKKQALTKCVRFSTEKLNSLEQEYFSCKYKINQLEYELYCNLKNKSINFIETIRAIAKDIGRIDAIASLSRCAIINNFTKPNFNTQKIYIENGYHPSLLKLKNEIIKNDSDIKNNSMIILTGANMSGKSTYLKHNAIICLLAQMGSYIPADYADLTITDKLFLRQGSTDDIINNNSSFMVEMNDLKFIIDNTTDNSFILLDEPAKSTNAKEGGAIARAFCEYMLKHFKSKAIIVTHNLELTKLENDFPSQTINYVIGNSEISETIIHNRKIKKGTIDTSLAINTAMLAELPKELIDNARKYIDN
ncbi:DNA mismatch repair protein MutS, partial [bacterium]|nr:DNA mismatch repair protein MutS [bacterium]